MDDLNSHEKDPKNYKWRFFYFNRQDKRILVPKRNPLHGATLNFANPHSYLIFVFVIIFLIVLLNIPIKK